MATTVPANEKARKALETFYANLAAVHYQLEYTHRRVTKRQARILSDKLRNVADEIDGLAQ